MKISDMYDIHRIIIDLEVAFCIDGEDYGEKDFNVILEKIYSRIVRQYQLDLRGREITEDSFYIGKSRSAAVLFVENVATIHSRLCGYLQIVRFNKQITIKPINMNYMGFSSTSFKSFLMAALDVDGISNIQQATNAIANRFGSVNSCIEKKLIMLMLVAYKFGLYELVSSIAEIFYLGMKIR